MNEERQNQPTIDPWTIARDPQLSVVARLRKLHQLEFDVRQALVASEEGMMGRRLGPSLAQVHAAIAELDPKALASPTPTKA